MAVRKHPTKKAENWWQIDYRPNGTKGKREIITFNGTEQEARNWEMELRRAAKGDTLRAFPSLNESVPDFIAEYKLNHQPAGVARTLQSFKHILPFFGTYQFSSITDSLITKYRTMRLEVVKPTTINKELAALSAFCKWAKKQGFHNGIVIERFSAKQVKAPKPTILQKSEVLAFLDALKDDTKGMFACMYYAGMRSSEAAGLQVHNVDLFTNQIRTYGKGNKERIIPIVPALKEILKARLKDVNKGLLWPARKGGERKDHRNTIYWACKRAGLRHIHPHMLRHAFGSHATSAGINLRTLQEVMGHSTPVVTEIYTQLTGEQIQNEMKKF